MKTLFITLLIACALAAKVNWLSKYTQPQS